METQEVLPQVGVDAVLYFLYRKEGSPHGHTIAAYEKWTQEMVTTPFAELAASEPEPVVQSPRLIDADEPLV